MEDKLPDWLLALGYPRTISIKSLEVNWKCCLDNDRDICVTGKLMPGDVAVYKVPFLADTTNIFVDADPFIKQGKTFADIRAGSVPIYRHKNSPHWNEELVQAYAWWALHDDQIVQAGDI